METESTAAFGRHQTQGDRRDSPRLCPVSSCTCCCRPGGLGRGLLSPGLTTSSARVISPPSFLEHLHKHQGAVLHPDYKTAFPSFEDALHRLLPYHVYQGALPSPSDYHRGEASRGCPHRALLCGVGGRHAAPSARPNVWAPGPLLFLAVDEEFETVSTQLLKRTQAMLNKYRLLLLEESRVGWPRLPLPPGDPALPWGREGGGPAGR